MGRLLLIAVRNLLQNRRRSLLLGGAIVAVTCLLILLGAIGNGIYSTMLHSGTAMITGHVNIGGFFKYTPTQAAPVVTHASTVLQDVKELVPEATQVLDRARAFAKIVSESDTAQAGIAGVDMREEHEFREVLQIIDGDLDTMPGTHSILLFEKQAERLGVSVGDEVTLSTPVLRGQNNSLDVRVAAIAKDMGLISIMSAYVSKETVRDLYLFDPDATGVIFVYLDDPELADEVEARLRAGLIERGHLLMDKDPVPFYAKFERIAGEDWTGQKLDLTTWEEELAGMTWTLKTFDTITSILVGILLVIIVIGVMNTMWISVRDRTREIGTLRAIGMGRFRILVMFLLEMLVLSVVSSAVGVGLGTLITAMLNAAHIPVSTGFQIFLMSDTLKMAVSNENITNALVLVPVLTTLGAMFPAMRAARLRPVTAMHHVG